MNPILIAVLAVLGVLFIVYLVVGGIKWNASHLGRKYFFKPLDINKSREDYARVLLDEKGLNDVEIKKANFFTTLFVGNTYSTSKKTIILSWAFQRRTNVVDLARVCYLVGLAELHAEGVSKLKSIQIKKYFSWLPSLLVPLAIIGLILDLVVLQSIGYWTIIFSAAGLGLTLFTFIMSCIAANREFRAYDKGKQNLLDMAILTLEEEEGLGKLIKAWKQLTVVDVIFNSFIVIYFALKLLLGFFKLFGRKK